MNSAAELADRLYATCTTFADYLDGLTAEQWRTICGNHPHIRIGDEDEHRPVAVVAYHTVAAMPRQVEMLRAIVAGEAPPLPDRGRNAQQALEHPDPDQAETVAALRRNAADLAAMVRGLSAEELARTGRTFLGEQTVAQVVDQICVGHVTWHEGSIRATLGG